MINILALIISKISFSSIAVLWKKLNKNGAHFISSLSIFIFSVPVLLLLGFLMLKEGKIVINPLYILLVILWVIPVFLSNLFDVYLLKYQSLTEQSSYKLTISTILAMLIDIFVFDTRYKIWTLVAVFLFFTGGIILTKNKRIKNQNLPLSITLLLIMIIAGLDVIDYGLYKKGLLMQPSIFSHIFISQTILFISFFAVGFKKLLLDLKFRVIGVADIVYINLLIIIYLILEAFVVKELPLVIIVSASILPLTLYSLYDFKSKEINFSYKSIAALILVTLGIIILSLV